MNPHASSLRQSYEELSRLWDQMLQDKSSNRQTDPWIDDSKDDTDPPTDFELLSAMAHLHVSLTTLSVKSHLESLAAAYMPSAIGEWPFHSAFTLCREVLEGSALIVWLGDPQIPQIERARRTLRLLAWSSHHAERASEPGIDYKALADSTGLLITDSGGRVPKVDGEAFGQVTTIRTAFPDTGTRLYNILSGYAHHAPWRLAPATLVEMLENGVVSSRRLMIGQHHQACADTALVVGRAIEVWDGIFVRTTDRSAQILAIAEAANRRAQEADHHD